MIPLRDVIPSRTTPWVTLLLIAVNAIVFVITLLYQGGLARHFRRQVPLAEAYVAEIPEWAREAVSSLPA